jgi:hypothetical protein
MWSGWSASPDVRLYAFLDIREISAVPGHRDHRGLCSIIYCQICLRNPKKIRAAQLQTIGPRSAVRGLPRALCLTPSP